MNDRTGCEFGKLLKRDVEYMDKKLDEILSNQKELFNHQSSRWPKGAVVSLSIIIAIASALLTSFIQKLFIG